MFNFYAGYIMQNAGLDESQDGIKIAWRNINNLRYADDTTLMAESEEELKSLLMRMKEESEKTGLKLNIKKTYGVQSHKFMANRRGESGNSDRFYFLGVQNHCNGNHNYEIKRLLLLERKAVTNLDSILRSRNITMATKVHIVKAMFFPVVMYRCESWAIKKIENQRIDDFELWCWRRLLRVPWTVKRSNHSILKEMYPEILQKDRC